MVTHYCSLRRVLLAGGLVTILLLTGSRLGSQQGLTSSALDRPTDGDETRQVPPELTETPEVGLLRLPPPTPQPTYRGRGAPPAPVAIPNTPYYYYYDSRPIRLEPVGNEIVVGVDKEEVREIELLVRGEASLRVEESYQHASGEATRLRLQLMPGAPELETVMERLRSYPGVKFISPVFKGSRESVRFHCTDTIAAQFKEGVSEASVRDVLDSLGLSRKRKMLFDERTWILRLCRPHLDAIEAANALFQSGLVEYSEPNFAYTIRTGPRPEPRQSSRTEDACSGLRGDYWPGWHLEKIQAQEARSLVAQHGSYLPIVAVLDTGVQLDHPDLDSRVLPLGYDAVVGEGAGSEGAPDPFCPGNSHGTAVAGIAAAEVGNGIGADGVAQYVKIMPVRVGYKECSGKTWEFKDEWIVRGIEWAIRSEHRADVINLSLGSPSEQKEFFHAAVREAWEVGTVVVASAGNDSHSEVEFPAAYPEVIAVGGTDSADERYNPLICQLGELLGKPCGSNYGRALDVMAPYPWIYTTCIDGDYASWWGTSFSAPQVAAIAAMMKAVRPELSPDEVQDIIQRTADKTGGYSYDQYLDEGGWNEQMGFGRVNAKKAVEAVVDPPRLNLRTRLKWVEGDNHASKVAVAVIGPRRAGLGERQVLYSGSVTTDQSGQYNGALPLYGVTSGEYTVCAKPEHYLGKCVRCSLSKGQTTTIDFSEGDYVFRPGDFNIGGEDGKVNSMDWAPFIDKWMSCIDTQNPSDCEEIDLDRNGVVNGRDIVLRHNVAGNEPSSDGEYPYGLWRPFSGSTANGNSDRVQTLQSGRVLFFTLHGTHGVGDVFDVNVMMDLRFTWPGVDAANVIVRYDPGVLEVVDAFPSMAGTQIAPGPLFPTWSENSVDETRGEITFTGRVDQDDDPVRDADDLATITFRAKAAIPKTEISAYVVSNETLDSNAAERESLLDALTEGDDQTLVITGSPERARPGVTVVPPSTGFIHTYRVMMQANTEDAYDQVQWVEFQTWYDDNWHAIDTDTDSSDGWSVEWDTTGIDDQVVYLWAYAALPGGEGSSSMSEGIMLDRTDPDYVSCSSEPPSRAEAGTVTTVVETSDNLSGVQRVEMYVNDAPDGSLNGDWIYVGEADNPDGDRPFTAQIQWETEEFSDGVHRVAFAIEDRASNWNRWSGESLPVIIYLLGTSAQPSWMIRGDLQSNGERNVHPLSVDSPQWISIRMFGEQGLDPYLELRNDQGTLLMYDDNGATYVGLDSFFTYPLPSAGTYSIISRGYGQTIGGYRLGLESGHAAGIADVNRDCVVSMADLTWWVNCYLWGGSCQGAVDINADGVVDETDEDLWTLCLIDGNGPIACPPVSVYVQDYPAAVAASDQIPMSWTVIGATYVAHTNIQWGSYPGSYDHYEAVYSGSPGEYSDTFAAPSSGPIYFVIRAQVDGTDYYSPEFSVEITPSPSPTVGPDAQVPLHLGWNLVSVPRHLGDTSVTAVLSNIEGQYDLVYAYDASDTADPWKKYNTAAPSFLNDLTDIDETMGLWIRATEAVTLTVSGSVPSSTDISLYTGWNLVGYPSQTTRTVAEALASIEGKYDLVYAYDAWDAEDPWKKYNTAAPPFLNDLTEIGPTWGYWIRVSEDCTWTLP